LSQGAIFGFLLTRLFIVPTLCTVLVLGARELGVFPDDRILLLVLLIECAMPSANMVIILCQVRRLPVAGCCEPT